MQQVRAEISLFSDRIDKPLPPSRHDLQPFHHLRREFPSTKDLRSDERPRNPHATGCSPTRHHLHTTRFRDNPLLNSLLYTTSFGLPRSTSEEDPSPSIPADNPRTLEYGATNFLSSTFFNFFPRWTGFFFSPFPLFFPPPYFFSLFSPASLSLFIVDPTFVSYHLDGMFPLGILERRREHTWFISYLFQLFLVLSVSCLN